MQNTLKSASLLINEWIQTFMFIISDSKRVFQVSFDTQEFYRIEYKGKRFVGYKHYFSYIQIYNYEWKKIEF